MSPRSCDTRVLPLIVLYIFSLYRQRVEVASIEKHNIATITNEAVAVSNAIIKKKPPPAVR
jgi:hypothetical protein